jgi:hypothetical protein
VRISAKSASKCDRNDLTRQTDGQLVGYAGNDQSDFYGCSQFVCNQTKFDIKSIESVIRFPIESEDFGYGTTILWRNRTSDILASSSQL